MRATRDDVVVSPRSLALLIVASVAAHALFLIASRTFLVDWRWPHEPLHAVVEAMGAFIALSLVPALLHLEGRGSGTSYNIAIANALVAMGILDGAHAAMPVSSAFVWLHSIATLLGGVLLALVWAPAGSLVTRIRPLHVALVSLALVAVAITQPHLLPDMIDNGSFTLAAELANMIGGALFFVAAIRLVSTYRSARRADDLLFVIHCGLFGGAAIMFESSALWDAAWWGWHVLRLLAYLVALWFLILSLQLEGRALVARTREIEAQHRALERSNADLQQFAYVASHDLQEPLRQMASFTELLARRYGDQLDARAHGYMQYVMSGALRMQQLINDLLEFARVGKHDIALVPTDSAALIAGAQGDLRALIDDSGTQVTHDALPVVMGHAPQLARVFQNLVSNAIKFRGEVPPRVHIAAVRDGDMWTFSVADNGIGIEPTEAGRIFQMFQRLHPRGAYPGTGIGLAIAKKIVETHGGRIWFESQAGAGTTFYFTLRGTE